MLDQAKRPTTAITELRRGVMRHPFELVVCLITFLSIERVISLLVSKPEVLAASENGLLSMAPILLWVWCIMGISGSLLMLIGLTYSVFSARGIDLEAAGLWLAGSMWLSAAFVTMYVEPTLWQQYAQYLVIASGCGIRLIVLSKIRHVIVTTTTEDGQDG